MELVSLCPFPAECLLWEADAGQASLTVVVKVTVRLVHEGDAVVHETQLPITGDEAWDDNPTASLFHPGDRAPLKPKTDLLLVGHAYAPGGRAVDRLVATLRVGDFSKSVTVNATRLWTRSPVGFVPGPALPFEQMPLRYERGPLSEDNPVGVDPASQPLEGAAVSAVLAPVAPATAPCFGPIAGTWRPRRQLLGEAGRFWALAFESAGAVPSAPAPRGLDFRFFNSAPPDQQTSLLRQRADVELVNLHPVHATLRTKLPALKPQVFRVGPPNGRPVEVALRCDTLWIEGDRGIACLVWRGLTDVPAMSADAIGSVFVVADQQGRRVRWEQVERAWREGVPIEATEAGALDALAMRHDAIRGRGEAAASASAAGGARAEKDETRAYGLSDTGSRVLPFVDDGSTPLPARAEDLRASASATPFVSARESDAGRDSQSSGHETRAEINVDDTHDRLPDEPSSPALPFVDKPAPMPFHVAPPAMIAVPPAPPAMLAIVTAPQDPDPEALDWEIPEHDTTQDTAKMAARAPVPAPMIVAPAPKADPPKTEPKSDPVPDGVPEGFDPKDVPIAKYGSISAELMVRRSERPKVLQSHRLNEPVWERVHTHWTGEMGRETARGEGKLLAQFDAAYVETLGKLRKPIGVPEYAAILVAIERGGVDKQLASLQLSLSDLMRVQRVWTRKLADDPDLQKELGRAVDEVRARPEPSA